MDAPENGSIIRQPLASIIHWQVPEVVQSTIGVSESPDNKTTSSSLDSLSAVGSELAIGINRLNCAFTYNLGRDS